MSALSRSVLALVVSLVVWGAVAVADAWEGRQMGHLERSWRALARRHRALGLLDTAAEHDLEADLCALWECGTPLDLIPEPSGWSVVAALRGEGQMLRLIQGHACPRPLDPSLPGYLRRHSLGAVGDPCSAGARSLLARAEGEAATVDGMPVEDLIALGVALESAPSLGPEAG